MPEIYVKHNMNIDPVAVLDYRLRPLQENDR